MANTSSPPPFAVRFGIGDVIRGYRLEQEVGGGGMGRVYRASKDGEAVALKVPVVDPSGLEPGEWDTLRMRIKREAGVLEQLRHPNVIPLLESLTHPRAADGVPVLVFPLVEGLTLGRFVRERRPTLRAFLENVMRPLLEALGYLHAHDVIHRDVKPGNVLIREGDGHVLLIDLGIAKVRTAATCTRVGTAMGTGAYLAPELLRYFSGEDGLLLRDEEPPSTPAQDLYALGVTLYEVLVGANPFKRLPHTLESGVVSYLKALNEAVVASPSAVNPALPAAIDALVLRLMAKLPEQRFVSATQALTALQGLLSVADAAFDVPLCLPTAEELKRRMGQTPPTVSGRGHDAGELPASIPIELSRVEVSAAAAPAAAFNAPTAAPREAAFVPPEAPPSTAGHRAAPELEVKLPSALLRAKERLAQPPRRGLPPVLLGVLGAALVVGLFLLVQGPAARPASSSSLLAAAADGGVHVFEQARLPALPPGGASSDVPYGAVASGTAGAAGMRTRPGRGEDSRAIDALLAREYGEPRAALDAGTAATPEPPSWLKRGVAVGVAPKPTKTSLGVPMGSEVPARLMRPLDSRTVSSGPVVARLARSYAVLGNVVLPSGTLVYGAATPTSAGRFDVRFNRLRLPDNREVPLQALAYDAEDRKPGVRASQRTVQAGAVSGPGLGEKLVKGAAGTLLAQVNGEPPAELARGAGQTVLSHTDEASAHAAPADVLVLDAPADFTLFFVETL